MPSPQPQITAPLLSRYSGCAGTTKRAHADIIHGERECPLCKAERESAEERALLTEQIRELKEAVADRLEVSTAPALPARLIDLSWPREDEATFLLALNLDEPAHFGRIPALQPLED